MGAGVVAYGRSHEVVGHTLVDAQLGHHALDFAHAFRQVPGLGRIEVLEQCEQLAHVLLLLVGDIQEHLARHLVIGSRRVRLVEHLGLQLAGQLHAHGLHELLLRHRARDVRDERVC